MDSNQDVYAAVSKHYSSVSNNSTKHGEDYGKRVAQSFGYSEEELASVPADSNLGVSCGNPLAVASLREGETVIDLGSGGGFDVFLAAAKVGSTGRAIGVDMNKDMLALAEKNKEKSGNKVAQFVEAPITNIPLEDSIANAIISNCVINLVPEAEKQIVFNEMFRLLKPGGRVAVSDILAKRPLPEKVQKCAAAYVGCVAGASLVSQYQEYFKQAGFQDVVITDVGADLNVYINTLPEGSKTLTGADKGGKSSCTPAIAENISCCSGAGMASGEGLDLDTMAAELGDTDLNEWVGSYKIFAIKP